MQYFPSLYGVTVVKELKGLHITKYDMMASNSVKDVLNTPSDQQNCFKNHHCFAIALILYVTRSFHLVVTRTQILSMQLFKMELSLTS